MPGTIYVIRSFQSCRRELSAVLARTADLAREEEEYWTSKIDRLAVQYLRPRAKAVLVNADDLNTLAVAVQRRLLRRAVQMIKGDLREINLFHIDALLRLAAQREGHGRSQAPGIDVFRSFEWLRFAKPRTESRSERDYSLPLEMPGPRPNSRPTIGSLCRSY